MVCLPVVRLMWLGTPSDESINQGPVCVNTCINNLRLLKRWEDNIKEWMGLDPPNPSHIFQRVKVKPERAVKKGMTPTLACTVHLGMSLAPSMTLQQFPVLNQQLSPLIWFWIAVKPSALGSPAPVHSLMGDPFSKDGLTLVSKAAVFLLLRMRI